MLATYHPAIKGFEFKPQGRLLQSVIEMEGQMGLAYERCIDYVREKHHSHDRHSFSFPRSACVAEVQVKTSKGEKKGFRLDSSKMLSIPEGEEHNHRGKTLVYDTMALYPDPGPKNRSV